MKIAIATDWFLPRQGGIEAQLAALAERLQRRGHEVTVVTSTPGVDNGVPYRVERVDVARIPIAGVALSPNLPRALRGVLAGRFDVVHAHVSVVSPVGYLAALMSASSAPIVVTFHSVLRLKRLLLRALNVAMRLDRRPILWTAVSDLVAGQARNALGVDVLSLPNGIDLDFWRGSDHAENVDRPVTFVSAMRLHRKKRPRQLIAAFGRAVTLSAAPARLVIAGAGPEAAAVRQDAAKAARTSGATIDVVGWQDGHSLRALYREADAFVLPSTREAFGIAALEARASGLPVVASRHAGCVEFLQHDTDALLCSDDDEFTCAMSRLISEPALRRRLAAADTTIDRYDWDAVAVAHERAYERARSQHSPPRGAPVPA